ncbi:proteasome subunit beta type-4-like [Ornithodoros turicata]|uniref:proteasome subunit beta type-4-like n=1 Tax=Ornithodoros turicata TaxID=34597 RepID=UPI003138CE40
MAFDMSVLPGSGSFGFHGNHTPATNLYEMGGRQRTLFPMTTATSVLGLKFDGGVIIGGDILGSYGSLARFRNCPRLLKVNDQIIVGSSGDYADFQFLKGVIEQKIIGDECLNDGFKMKPRSLYSWLTRVMYNRRSKFDPLWNTFVVAGLEDGVPFLGHVDLRGTAYEAYSIATGYGGYIAQPLMAEAYESKGGHLTKEEAREVLVKCLRILFYRDSRAFNKYQIGTVTSEGVSIEGPFELDTNWESATFYKQAA